MVIMLLSRAPVQEGESLVQQNVAEVSEDLRVACNFLYNSLYNFLYNSL
jgi:hypothetical protein